MLEAHFSKSTSNLLVRAFPSDILKFLQIKLKKNYFFYFTYSLLKYTLYLTFYLSNTLSKYYYYYYYFPVYENSKNTLYDSKERVKDMGMREIKSEIEKEL